MDVSLSKYSMTNQNDDQLKRETSSNAVAAEPIGSTKICTSKNGNKVNQRYGNTDDPNDCHMYGVYVDLFGDVVPIVSEDGVFWRPRQPTVTIDEEQIEIDDWNPIGRLHEHCAGRKLSKPEFLSVPVSKSYQHREKCIVKTNSVTISSEGVGRSIKAARKIAAKAVYEVLTFAKGYDRLLKIGIVSVEDVTNSISSTDENVKTIEVHSPIKITDDTDSIKSKIIKLQRENTDASQTIGEPTVTIVQKARKKPTKKLHDFCLRQKWPTPKYIISVIMTPTTNSTVHRHTVTCLVTSGSLTYRARSVASRKKVAKRIAAKAIYKVITCAQGYNEHLLNGTVSVVYTSGLSSSNSMISDENVEVHSPIKMVDGDATYSVGSQTDELPRDNTDTSQTIGGLPTGQTIRWEPISNLHDFYFRHNWYMPNENIESVEENSLL